MFINQEHQDRFNQLLCRDNTRKKDVERYALFYLVSGYEDLYRKVVHILFFTRF